MKNPQPITNCKPIIEYNAGKLSDAGVNGPHIKPTLGFRGIKEAGFGIYIVVEPDGDDDEGWLVGVGVGILFLLSPSSLSFGGGMYTPIIFGCVCLEHVLVSRK